MNDGIDASLARIRQLQAAVPRNQDQAPISLPRAPERAANPWDILTRLGFAMASSRNPSLFGQLGEAGINLQDYQRQQGRDAREENELELNRVYREAQLNFQREQLRGDPVRLATAEAALLEARARAEAARAQAGAAGREGAYLIPGMIFRGPNGEAMGVTRSGERRSLGLSYDDMMGAERQADTAYDRWMGRRDLQERRLRERLGIMPGMPMTPQQQREFTEGLRTWEERFPEPRRGEAAPAAAGARPAAPPPVVIDPAGRPLGR